jgi:DNA helicase-2/ATP-dependent DNA helicase PcrA
LALSPEQQLIVHHPVDRHGLVLAVAGSGKSTTMGERIAWLIEGCRFEPEHIIAVMFNDSASKELGEKLVKRLGARNAPKSMTYHKLGTATIARLLRAGKIEQWKMETDPYAAQRFAIEVLKPVCRAHGIKYPRLVAEVFLNFIDRVKSDLLPPLKVWENGDWDAKYNWFVPMFEVYEKTRAEQKKRFLADLIYDPVITMQKDPSAAAAISGRFKHIIVDEYQDICESQQALVRFNAGGDTKVMVVGDDDQTIYTWRGAKPSYILRDFARDFPNPIVYRLTYTWRYGHFLSCAANYVITGNFDRADKLCISGDKAPDTTIHLENEWVTSDEGKKKGSSGSKVLEIVSKRLAAGGRLSDVAVLVRTFSKSAASQYALLQTGIPFRLEGGDNASVLENYWVVGLLGWMDVALGHIAHRPYAGAPDPSSIMSLRKVINVPNLGLSWEGTNTLMSSILSRPDGIEGYSAFVSQHLKVTDGVLQQRIYSRGQLWKKVRALPQTIHPSQLVDMLIESLDLERAIINQAPNEDAAEENWALVQAFRAYVGANTQQRGLKEFVKHVEDLKSVSERAKTATDAIHITSIHRSKGLEWPCVIMVGLSQGSFPLAPKRKLEGEKAERHLEDERRLFYVGMTRAKNELWLVAPPDAQLIQWMRAGKSGSPQLENSPANASQFLYEANISLSRTMPTMLKRNLNLSVGDPEVYNAYLEACGIQYRLGKLSA